METDQRPVSKGKKRRMHGNAFTVCDKGRPGDGLAETYGMVAAIITILS